MELKQLYGVGSVCVYMCVYLQCSDGVKLPVLPGDYRRLKG